MHSSRKILARLFEITRNHLKKQLDCCRFSSDDTLLRSSIKDADRTKAITSYYIQSSIDQAAAKVYYHQSIRLGLGRSISHVQPTSQPTNGCLPE